MELLVMFAVLIILCIAFLEVLALSIWLIKERRKALKQFNQGNQLYSQSSAHKGKRTGRTRMEKKPVLAPYD